MSQHHFVVVYDSESNFWSLDWEANARFEDGTIWVPDKTNPDGGYWTNDEDSSKDLETLKIAARDSFAVGTLLGMMMITNDNASPVEEEIDRAVAHMLAHPED